MNSSPSKTQDSPKKSSGRFKRWFTIALFALLAYIILMPFIQPLLVEAFRWMPVVAVVGLGAAAFFVTRRVSAKRGRPMPRGLVLIGGGLSVALILGLVYSNTAQWMVESQLARHIGSPDELGSIPTTVENRILNRSTAVKYAKNTNRDNRKQTGRAHLVLLPKEVETNFASPHAPRSPDGRRMVWQVPLEYDIWWNVFGSVSGVIRVNAETPEMDTDNKTGGDASFWFGAESWVTKTIFRLRHPFCKPAQKIYWQKPNGEWVILISYTSYRPTITGTMIPVMTGVMEIGPHGGFTNYSPEEAAKLFDGASLFPPELARTYSNAYAKYHNGVYNKMVSQQELMEISEEATEADIYPNQNAFPYFQTFEKMGVELVVPFEPAGTGGYILTKLLFFDGITGKVSSYTLKPEEILNGPREALKNVRDADRQADWTEYAEEEPRLVKTKDGTYYLVTVIRNDGNSFAYIMLVLVDAKKLTSTPFQTVEELHRFIDEGVKPTPQMDAPKGN